MIIYDDFTTIYLCIIIINFDMWFILFITSLILTFTGTMSHVHIISWLTTLLFLIIIHYSMGLPLLIIIFFIRIFNYSLTRGSCGRNALKYKLLISLHFLYTTTSLALNSKFILWVCLCPGERSLNDPLLSLMISLSFS